VGKDYFVVTVKKDELNNEDWILYGYLVSMNAFFSFTFIPE